MPKPPPCCAGPEVLDRHDLLDTVHYVAVVGLLNDLCLNFHAHQFGDVHFDNLRSVDAHSIEQLLDLPQALVDEDVVVSQLTVAFDAEHVVFDLQHGVAGGTVGFFNLRDTQVVDAFVEGLTRGDAVKIDVQHNVPSQGRLLSLPSCTDFISGG